MKIYIISYRSIILSSESLFTKNLILGLVALIVIVLILTTFVDRAIRQSNKTPSFVNRKFKYTALELFWYCMYLLIFCILGIGFIYICMATKNLIVIIFSLLGGFLMSANFLLFVNHVLHEVLQNVRIDHERRLLISKRLGKSVQIELNNPTTQKIHYVPLWRKGYGPKNFKLFGALFSKTVIQNAGTKIQLSSMRNKHLNLSEYLSEENTKVVKQQINFIIH